jgi:hypothetical protein
MKTTLNLPDDVAELLRKESARRGGRKKASLSRLVSWAVREVYAGIPETPAIVDLQAGRVVVKRESGMPVVDSEGIAEALNRTWPEYTQLLD